MVFEEKSSPWHDDSLEGFNEAIRLDRKNIGGGILSFIREDIPTKALLSLEVSPIE